MLEIEPTRSREAGGASRRRGPLLGGAGEGRYDRVSGPLRRHPAWSSPPIATAEPSATGPKRSMTSSPSTSGRSPRGPYSDEPLRFVHNDDGVVAYAVGFKGEDNGGRLHPKHKRERKYNVGSLLWNPELRRRPATAPAAPRASPNEPGDARRPIP